jgi:outer membrane protein OmpA-like peptidoglycan-associated protein
VATSASSILEGERGHRRGVVLGLTMAEIMLLLLFCLLLAAAGLLSDREQKLQEAIERAQRADEALADAVLAAPHRSDEDLAAELKDLKATAGNQAAALVRLRELERRLAQTFPSITESATDETWRELVVAEEVGREVLESGVSVDDIRAAIEQAAKVRAEPPSPAEDTWPPMIRLDSDEFRFVRNSAELSEEFRQRLQTEVVDRLAAYLREFDADVIEVVGHTDEQVIASTRPSTLDDLAIEAMGGGVPITELVPADNAGLGLARAISVANALSDALGVPGVKIIPLSAAQLVKPGDIISDGLSPGDEADRRRIEIRVRRSDTAVELP